MSYIGTTVCEGFLRMRDSYIRLMCVCVHEREGMRMRMKMNYVFVKCRSACVRERLKVRDYCACGH